MYQLVLPGKTRSCPPYDGRAERCSGRASTFSGPDSEERQQADENGENAELLMAELRMFLKTIKPLVVKTSFIKLRSFFQHCFIILQTLRKFTELQERNKLPKPKQTSSVKHC